MSDRKNIPKNLERRLWGQSGGFCQNPTCNKSLIIDVDGTHVSIANMAHVIGSGKNGPRSEHQLAEHIEKEGEGNLMMLCLECHKVVDELEKKFSVEQMLKWKSDHIGKIDSIFGIPKVNTRAEARAYVVKLLVENQTVHKEYGPDHEDNLNPESDLHIIWKRKILDIIVPNNRKLTFFIEKNSDFLCVSEMEVFNIFKQHVDDFEAKHLFNVAQSGKMFPKGMTDIFEGEKDA